MMIIIGFIYGNIIQRYNISFSPTIKKKCYSYLIIFYETVELLQRPETSKNRENPSKQPKKRSKNEKNLSKSKNP